MDTRQHIDVDVTASGQPFLDLSGEQGQLPSATECRLGTESARQPFHMREMRKDIVAIDKRIADLDHKLTRGLASNRIWMLPQSAAVLGVMARGFGWL